MRIDSGDLAALAVDVRRILDDAGLKKDDIDGLCTGPTLSGERASELWGMNPRWSGSGDAAQCIIEATMAINCGLCTTVALVYGNAQRSMNTAYGGSAVTGGATRFLLRKPVQTDPGKIEFFSREGAAAAGNSRSSYSPHTRVTPSSARVAHA